MASAVQTISIPASEYEELKKLQPLVAQLLRDNQRLSEQLELMIRRVFGKKTERLDPAQLRLFLEDLQAARPNTPEQTEEESAPEETVPRRQRGHGRTSFPEHLPREVIELDIPETERTCRDCGEELTCFGEEVTERGHIVPARMLVRRYVRKKYGCPAGHGVTTPPLPASLVDKGKYEPSVYANLVVAKYLDHLPLNRLSGIYKRHGLSLSKSTMWEMLQRLDEVVVAPILVQMRTELLQGSHLQADETPVTVRLEDQGGTRQGYIWTYGWGRRRLLDFTMSRSRDGPRHFLGSWKGVLQTDGYSGYDEVTRTNGLVRAGCWAHARRKLKDALDLGSTDAGPLLAEVQRLFAIEEDLRTRRDEQRLVEEDFCALRLEVRAASSAPVLERIRDLAGDLQQRRSTLPKSQLGKALGYLDNQWEPLTVFLGDGLLDIHNNDSERTLRHVVTGRKNWLFFGSPNGGAVGARLFSIVATVKALDIHPEAYLEDAARRIDTTPASEIASLTPWAWAEQQG